MKGEFVRNLGVGAIKGELPAVEGAGEGIDRAEIGENELAPAMGAHIIMRFEAAIVEAHHDDAFLGNVESNEVARVSQITRGTGKQPGAGPHSVPFRLFIVGTIIAPRVRPRRAVLDSRCPIIEGMRLANVNIPEPKIKIHRLNSSRLWELSYTKLKKTNMIDCYFDMWQSFVVKQLKSNNTLLE
jgi:hypothetical protein